MGSAYLRLAQLITGVVVAILLGIHIVLSHQVVILGSLGIEVTEPTAWASMIERASQGTFVGIYIALLACGLYHAIYGLRNIILEVTPSVKTGRIITRALIAIGIIVFIWGTYVPIALFTS